MEKLLKRFKFKNIILGLILFLGFALRFYQLGNIPSSLNRDEPAIGYNAYSILKIGKDEWGEKLPLSFKSYGDYKSPLYIYLTAFAIKIFGLNEFAVRFWAALAGGLTVLVIYFLTKELFKPLISQSLNFLISLIASFLLAISPWHIFYSRFSFEANLALLFNATILYFLAKSNFKKIDLPILFLFLLTFFTYSSSLIIWPIFLFIWFLFLLIKIVQNYKKRLYSQRVFNYCCLIFKLLTLLLILGIVFYKQIAISNQKNRVTIFANPQLRLDFNQKRREIVKRSSWQAKIFYNQYFYYGRIFLVNYLKSFSFNFLFGGGGAHPWHKTTYASHFYPSFCLLLIIGLIFFLKSRKINRGRKFFLILFILLTPIPSAITIDAPHATRLLNLFFFLTFLAGLGLGWLIKEVKPLGLVFLLILASNFLQFTRFYFIDYKQNPPLEILPGLKEAILYLNQHKLGEERVVFDSHSDGAYVYLLFYTAYPPDKFLQEVKRYSPDAAGLEWVEKFDRFLFVENPKPDSSLKEIYILKGDNNLGQKEITKIKSRFNDKIYYTISANF